MREFPLISHRTYNEPFMKSIISPYKDQLVQEIADFGAAFDAAIEAKKEAAGPDDETKYQKFPPVPLFGNALAMGLTFDKKPGQFLFAARFKMRQLLSIGFDDLRFGLGSKKMLQEFNRNKDKNHKSNAHIGAFVEEVKKGDHDEAIAEAAGLTQEIAHINMNLIKELLVVNLTATWGSTAASIMQRLRFSSYSLFYIARDAALPFTRSFCSVRMHVTHCVATQHWNL